jgi:hypothetical protein
MVATAISSWSGTQLSCEQGVQKILTVGSSLFENKREDQVQQFRREGYNRCLRVKSSKSVYSRIDRALHREGQREEPTIHPSRMETAAPGEICER